MGWISLLVHGHTVKNRPTFIPIVSNALRCTTDLVSQFPPDRDVSSLLIVTVWDGSSTFHDKLSRHLPPSPSMNCTLLIQILLIPITLISLMESDPSTHSLSSSLSISFAHVQSLSFYSAWSRFICLLWPLSCSSPSHPSKQRCVFSEEIPLVVFWQATRWQCSQLTSRGLCSLSSWVQSRSPLLGCVCASGMASLRFLICVFLETLCMFVCNILAAWQTDRLACVIYING